jgi:hypothetical protein
LPSEEVAHFVDSPVEDRVVEARSLVEDAAAF